ncbi:dephospho-CoA kinase [Polyangium jinanense]|uniref:Dephospho-CoA kinase n=1 Tax=Polyangium jinanense TaxID=2829994 RepID=A0A9X3X6J9_9BACT|nr:dephospho-CoA kinase [Polyangium jinanense]MDC3957982.1 dephospho-CoA kinase [Polyangium jinanense]MDC3983535.1 dephospho-CoA kinase [Polyangium jinanense]
MPFVFFGLTGGIACGKSTVAARFREQGVQVIDADVVARQAVAPGTSGLTEIVKLFGEGVLRADGTLDRGKLGVIVFGDEEKRRALNRILHPRIGARTMMLAQELAERGEPLACYEATLLVENGMQDAFRPLVVVTAPEELQVKRTMERDGVDEKAARARIRAQMPVAEKVKVADYVIDTSGTMEETLQRADEVLTAIRAKAAES